MKSDSTIASQPITVLFLFGTRPEAIKMAPLITAFSGDPNFRVRVAVTAQHREMLDQVLTFFDIPVDYDLNVMTANQTLHRLTADLIARITDEVLARESFDFVFVQGDTTTVLASAMAAFYRKIPVLHIEAGLRSGDMHAPFPEEMNRVLTSRLATLHFCPTENARQHLLGEGIRDGLYVVGNTVIDALFSGLRKVDSEKETSFLEKFPQLDTSRKMLLVTCHRRENFGAPFEAICSALTEIASRFEDQVQIVYPVHLNPNIRERAHALLVHPNIVLIEPLDYPELIWMMDKSHLILTDSGGIQEEAPSLGKPVLVLREVTERTEGVDAGTALLVGSSKERIVAETAKLLTDAAHYDAISKAVNPYGDGHASEQIKAALWQYCYGKNTGTHPTT